MKIKLFILPHEFEKGREVTFEVDLGHDLAHFPVDTGHFLLADAPVGGDVGEVGTVVAHRYVHDCLFAAGSGGHLGGVRSFG